MAKIDAFFRLMNFQGASDLHMMAGSPPCLRIYGEIEPVKYRATTNEELMEMIAEITPDVKMKEFEETGDADFSYDLPGVSRFRVNLYQQISGAAASFRQIPSTIMTLDQLGLPPVLRRFAMLENGLVLVTGPAGSGKSTTLAAIMDYANRNRRDHIITIEDPIEYRHNRYNCIVSHREVGPHTRSFDSALRGALREDPDIIMVGEMRNLETISLTLEAASTGHLVFATLHTPSAPKSIDRIIDVFPADARDKVRTTLSDSLKGVVSQALCKRMDRRGRIAALEIMVGTPAVSTLIREGKPHQLINTIETGKQLGMRSLDSSLYDLYKKKIISPEEAFRRANNKEAFLKILPSVPEEWEGVFAQKKKGDAYQNYQANTTVTQKTQTTRSR